MIFPIAKLKSLRCRFILSLGVVTILYIALIYVFLNIKDPKYFSFNVTSVAKSVRKKLDIQYVVVHIDLKGAPPNLNFLTSLLAMVKARGANAVLMEYEDMFPYEEDLVNLSAPFCYSRTELKRFLNAAKDQDIEVIPLIQTFGHMEYVLKLAEFVHLREDPAYPDSICPAKKESQALIKRMLEQVIRFHNDVETLKHIHIGLDEVYALNLCPDCQSRGLSRVGTTLHHMTTVIGFVKEMSPNTTVLLWDDMLRPIKAGLWHNLTKNVTNKSLNIAEPVYWGYEAVPNIRHVLLRRYHLSFDNIWVATAFKGADGPIATIPNVGNRFANHYHWLKTISRYTFGGEREVYKFKGIILTGWSRYSHFDPLCELLPLSLPSLFLNLLVINRFRYGFEDNEVLEDHWRKMFLKHFYVDIKNDLKCPFLISNPDFTNCQFDTIDLYRAINTFTIFKRDVIERIYIGEHHVLPVLKYYLQKNYVHKRTLEMEIYDWKGIQSQLRDRKEEMYYYLSKFYDKVAVDEYIGSKTYEMTERLAEILKTLNMVIASNNINFTNFNMIDKRRRSMTSNSRKPRFAKVI